MSSKAMTASVAQNAQSVKAKQSVQAPAIKPQINIANGTLEAIKWVALVLMTLDHVNKYLFAHQLPFFYELGRIAMPLFVFVLAYNLARPNALLNGAHWRVSKRLAIYGVVASLPYMALGTVVSGWWPLNIMFLLLAATAIFGLVEHGGRLQGVLAVAVFAIAGSLVEYWWPALALAICCWLYCKRPSLGRLSAMTLCLIALSLVNQNLWACAALPIIVAAPKVDLQIIRCRQLFYAYYPLHLSALWVVKKLL